MGEHAGFHEQVERLSNKTQDTHRALVSLQEELEAVDWYQQRADACTDAELKEILLHNMREEIEHAAMVLEWLRRRHDTFDSQLRTYLFTEGDILEVEENETGGGGDGEGESKGKSLQGFDPTRRATIGKLRRGDK